MPRTPRRSLAATALLLAGLLGLAPLAPAGAAAGEGGEPIVTSDLLKIRAAGQVDVSPDGRRAVYVVTSMGKGSDGELRYFRHLWLAEFDGDAATRQITHGERSDGSPIFSPDGTRIAFVRASDDPDHPDPQIWILPLAGGEAWRLTDAEHGASQPLWSPDGTRIAYASDVPMWSIEGTPPWIDGRWVYFTTRREGAFPLLRVPAAGGPPESVETIVGGPRGVRSFDLEGDRLVFAATEVADPNELYAAAADGSCERRLGSLNADWLAGKRIVQPSEHWLERPDGRRVEYWVMEPASRTPGVRYPVALEIHGGPSAMWGPGELTMWHELQLLASWGYGVVYSNPRGSSGYGFDFKKANYRNWGTAPAGDALAALDETVKLPWADPDQLFLAGGSYAGYLTAWIVGHDQRFDAAVAQRGVYDLSFFFGEGNAWRLVPYHFGGYPREEETREVLDANSPLTYVEAIHTPLLIIHSDRDLRTGTNESETLYKSLKVLGRPVEYVRYPDEGHDLSRTGNPKRRMDRLDRIVEFFERYVSHPEAPAGAAPAGR